jgi:DEAD/DEAH box helicase domain-containing protein
MTGRQLPKGDGPLDVIRSLINSSEYSGQIVHAEQIDPADARYADLIPPLPLQLSTSLRSNGIESLYTHQSAAVEAARAGESFVVSTTTASGKTLCYNLPVIEAIELDRSARALYMFPTKALAQDQLRRLGEHNLPYLKAHTYDGDTPRRERPFIKSVANIVLTNPDMLHCGILPYHGAWADFFRKLRYVVIDEIHAYRGVFGSHVALIMRRLRLIAEFYGSSPVFICASATLADPAKHAESLTGLKMKAIEDDGAPRGRKTIIFWNPPYSEIKGERRSANVESVDLLVRLVASKCRTLVFTKARKTAEIILRYSRRRLSTMYRELPEKIASYRGGYRPEERREIERKLFAGELLGVASTTALELGVDIGGLDAVLMTGYPGTIVGAMQQMGRAGREKQDSLAVLIAKDDPLDQFIMRSPEYLLTWKNERAILNISNPYILGPQLACAIAEMPLSTEQIQQLFGEAAWFVVGELHRQGVLDFRGHWYWKGPDAPFLDVNIRSSGGSPFTIIAIDDRPHELGTVDSDSAFEVLHPGAVYLHAGEAYIVSKLEIDERTAYVEKTAVDYYTSAGTYVRTSVVGKELNARLACADAYYGDVSVMAKVTHYWRKKLFTEQRMSRIPLNLPEVTLDTKGVWFELDMDVAVELSIAGCDVMGSLHAMEHVLIGVLPILAICDRSDIGGVSTPSHCDCSGKPAVFVYDGCRGGVGISENAFQSLGAWLQAAKDALENCLCDDGCPGCVQSPKCGNDNQPLDKRGAIIIISRLLGSVETTREYSAPVVDESLFNSRNRPS